MGSSLLLAGVSSGKPANHERKNTLTPTQRESVPAKSPVPGVDPVVAHSPFDPHHRGATPEVYRGHLPPHLDPAMPFHRALDPGKYFVLAFFTFRNTVSFDEQKGYLYKAVISGQISFIRL